MVATRFAVAVHILLLVANRAQDEKATSEVIARTINTNPVVIRRITGRLARAGLIRVRRGPGGAMLARSAADITLGDVWRAMNDNTGASLLPLHDAARHCALGRNIGPAFASAESAMEQALRLTTLDSLTKTATTRAVAAF